MFMPLMVLCADVVVVDLVTPAVLSVVRVGTVLVRTWNHLVNLPMES